MKAYTDLEQSNKLAEMLPLESADMRYAPFGDTHPWVWVGEVRLLEKGSIPCWSLAALLEHLREIDFFPNIEAGEHGVTMNICYYDEEEGKLLNPVHDIRVKAETFIDACYEIIIKLNELNIL